MNAFEILDLDYCNSILYGFKKLADLEELRRLITGSSRQEHIILVLDNLQDLRNVCSKNLRVRN